MTTMSMIASSSLMTPPDVAVWTTTSADIGFIVTVNVSSSSTITSPATPMLMVLLVSPGRNAMLPDGNTLPVKSMAEAGCGPDPETT